MFRYCAIINAISQKRKHASEEKKNNSAIHMASFPISRRPHARKHFQIPEYISARTVCTGRCTPVLHFQQTATWSRYITGTYVHTYMGVTCRINYDRRTADAMSHGPISFIRRGAGRRRSSCNFEDCAAAHDDDRQ